MAPSLIGLPEDSWFSLCAPTQDPIFKLYAHVMTMMTLCTILILISYVFI